jgi:hypothetical protein
MAEKREAKGAGEAEECREVRVGRRAVRGRVDFRIGVGAEMREF